MNFFQTHQELSQLLQVTTRFTQNQTDNPYTISPVRRTVNQSVPTAGTGTEKEINSYTQKETDCLIRKLTTTEEHPDLIVMQQMISDVTLTITVDG